MKSKTKRWCEIQYLFLFIIAVVGAAGFWPSVTDWKENAKEFTGLCLCVATMAGVFSYWLLGRVGHLFLTVIYILVAIGALVWATIRPNERWETLIYGVGGAALVLITLIASRDKPGKGNKGDQMNGLNP